MTTHLLIFMLVPLVACESIYSVDDSAGLGRRFDGIGGLSGGGATSKLLVNYPEKQLNQILDYLFKPNFGASLQILKVEIGGDGQSTDGTESSHMHEPWDENYERGYEWWLMVEAKKRNPNIKLYGLPWSFPGWIGNGTQNPYINPDVTTDYIIRWIKAAKKLYDLDLDFVGIWNERNYDIPYIKTLKAGLIANGFNNIQLVAADGDWGISDDILKDPAFAKAVDIIGVHYPGTTTTNQSVETGKPLWSSEDYSTYNDEVGAGCWARILNQNYVNGNMTSTISWNLIASYYLSLPFGRDGLMTAVEPWSGHYVVQDPIWVSAHTTQFSEIGWRYLKHGLGSGHLDNGGSYVSLMSPDSKDFTMVIETMSHDHSKCIRPGLPEYSVKPQNATFSLTGSLASVKELNVWRSRLTFGRSASDSIFKNLSKIKVISGQITLSLGVDEIYTLTTVATGTKGSYGDSPDSAKFPLPYADDFESYPEFSEAFNWVPQAGVWEVRQSQNPSARKVNRQVMLNPPVAWCALQEAPINLGGSQFWSDLFIQMDVLVPSVNGTSGVMLGARMTQGGCQVGSTDGVFFTVFPSSDSGSFLYIVSNDTARKNILLSGFYAASLGLDVWHHLSLIVRGDSVYGYVGIDSVFQIPSVNIPPTGFVAYGTADYGIADFDNFQVESSGDLRVIKPNPRIPTHKQNIL
ncbi:hypothetical protein CAPTEDRAFT_162182 [Capitella teleta]|uniref:galactosylceramidase n=1 Tax=Capitella teleta TaxID=283909 RepID=R7U2H6_CAPTE|nr:hypothetical protein CAPTEDRAFT_162182 [Capitella teleta]|eukprot:ELU00545.1 hypothetical protein CAPTEDRAFT_162182 [Capitella teleta]